jgi:hypothetical protein
MYLRFHFIPRSQKVKFCELNQALPADLKNAITRWHINCALRVEYPSVSQDERVAVPVIVIIIYVVNEKEAEGHATTTVRR